MLNIDSVTKIFYTRQKSVTAVDNLTFQVDEGEIFGLLGPNGAGKTTTLRMVSTLLQPTSGRVTVGGFDTVAAANDVRSRLGFLTADMKLSHNFTPDELVAFFAKLNEVPDAVMKRRRAELYERLAIEEYRSTVIDQLSHGTVQKAAIAVSLIHSPPVVVFDEPTNGLDIITARSVIEYLKQLRDEGKTLLVSTHAMNIAEKLCDRVGIIHEGGLRCVGTPDELKGRYGVADLDDVFFAAAEVPL